MELVSFSFRNYRSITKTHKLAIGQSTILIGPNNEGKSNILRALVTAIELLELAGRYPFPISRSVSLFSRGIYNWDRDYPIHLQGKEPDGASVFTLEFQLTETEIASFWAEVHSNLNGTLPIEVSISKTTSSVKIRKKGPGGLALSKKADKIARFIAARINVEHIAAVRTADVARKIVQKMVDHALTEAEKQPAFKAALETIGSLQRPYLDKLGERIRSSLTQFLPDVKEVHIRIPKEERSRALRSSCEVLINDGQQTELKYKGDGAQSLAALSLMRHASETEAEGETLLIAIEEPESHLHPGAIHKVKAVLDELSRVHPLVITTHCPLFIDRTTIQNNIIVSGNKAAPATSLKELRKILGVRVSDNLQHASLVLLVEGNDDRMALTALFSAYATDIHKAILQGALSIDIMLGASNLPFKIAQVRDLLCQAHCFLDNDQAGLNAIKAAKEQGLTGDGDVHIACCPGLVESELEDLYDVSKYQDLILERFSVSLQDPSFKSTKKWSARIFDCFQRQGRPCNEAVLGKVKHAVCQSLVESPSGWLHEQRRPSIDGLIDRLRVLLRLTC